MKSLFYILLVLLSCQHRHSSMQAVVVRALEIVDQELVHDVLGMIQKGTNMNVEEEKVPE